LVVAALTHWKFGVYDSLGLRIIWRLLTLAFAALALAVFGAIKRNPIPPSPRIRGATQSEKKYSENQWVE